MVRFVVAEDGWYSATAEFKGLDNGDAYGYIFVDGVDCAAGRFSLQNKDFFSSWEKNRPGEMDVHPQATKWEDGTPVQAFARFFPPKPGYYSGTLALRGVTTRTGTDGAYGHVCVGGNREIAKVFYRATGSGAQSGMVHFGPVYLMAGEPLDFFVDPGPAGYEGMDRALGSLVLRREEDYAEPGKTVYDANVALHDNIDANNKPVSNPRVLADGAKWEWGYSTELADALTLFTAGQTGSNNDCYGYSNIANSFYNQILVRTANTMWITLLNDNPILLPVVPYMFNAHPSVKAKTVVRFTPSRDGRYTVKMRGRAFAYGNDDHVNFFTVVNGRLLGRISDRQALDDNVKAYPNQDIPTLVFEDVDLHAGDDVRLVIDPNVNQGSDRCGGSFAVIREGDIPGPGTDSVVNFACFTPGDSARVSTFAEQGRVKSGTT